MLKETLTEDTTPTGLEPIAYMASLLGWMDEAETTALQILDCYEAVFAIKLGL